MVKAGSQLLMSTSIEITVDSSQLTVIDCTFDIILYIFYILSCNNIYTFCIYANVFEYLFFSCELDFFDYYLIIYSIISRYTNDYKQNKQVRSLEMN